jgi:hypothetical protein
MTQQAERQVIEYLQTLREMDVEPEELTVLRARLAGRRSWRRRMRRALIPAVVLIAGSSALATATGVAPWWESERSIPPAGVANAGVPADVRAVVGVFRREPGPEDRSADGRAAMAGLRSPFVVDLDSIRAVGKTPLGESAFVVYARTDLDRVHPRLRGFEPPGGTQGIYVAVHGRFGGRGADGPHPLVDVERGTAWGINEVGHGHGRLFTAVLPDGVAAVEITFRDSSTVRYKVHDNVVIAGVAHESLSEIRWLSAGGQTLRTIQ